MDITNKIEVLTRLRRICFLMSGNLNMYDVTSTVDKYLEILVNGDDNKELSQQIANELLAFKPYLQELVFQPTMNRQLLENEFVQIVEDFGAYFLNDNNFLLDFGASLVLANKTVTFNNVNQSIIVSGGALPAGTTVVYTPTSVKNAGTYQMKANLSNIAYRPKELTGTLIINKAASVITSVDKTATFTGSPISLTGTLNHAESVIAYSPNNKYTNAGSYPIKLTVPASANYLASSKDSVLTISKAASVITSINQKVKFTGSALTVVASLNHAESVLTFSPSKDFTEIGVHTVTISAPASTNYLTSSKVITFEIEAAE